MTAFNLAETTLVQQLSHEDLQQVHGGSIRVKTLLPDPSPILRKIQSPVRIPERKEMPGHPERSVLRRIR